MQTSMLQSYMLLVLIGVLGGFFVVPLNALFQHRGKHSVGAGNAIAVQNLGENTAMLLMLGLYSLVVMAGAPMVALVLVLVWSLRWLLPGCGFGRLCKNDVTPEVVCPLKTRKGAQRPF